MSKIFTKKIVVIGHFGVGKTSLIRRFVESSFSEDYIVTIGVQVKKREVIINDITVNLILWDLEGKNTFEEARKSYLLGTHGILYVVDVSRPVTYTGINSEIDIIKEKFPRIPIKVLANKRDLLCQEELTQFKKSFPFPHYKLTSAKTGENVEELFVELALDLI